MKNKRFLLGLLVIALAFSSCVLIEAITGSAGEKRAEQEEKVARLVLEGSFYAYQFELYKNPPQGRDVAPAAGTRGSPNRYSSRTYGVRTPQMSNSPPSEQAIDRAISAYEAALNQWPRNESIEATLNINGITIVSATKSEVQTLLASARNAKQQWQQQVVATRQAQQAAQQAEQQYQRDAEPESSFTFELTRDGRGIIITRYTGTATEVRIPVKIQDFPVQQINGAFTGNTAVTSVVIPQGVTNIGERTFQGCTRLTSVVIPESLTTIGNSAFQGCVNLASVNRFAPNIGDSAFQGCRSLTGEINLSSQIGRNAFAGTGISAVSLGGNVGSGAFADCPNLQRVAIKGVISDGLFRGCIALTTIDLSGVTTIGANSFSGCTSLAGITIPGSVLQINDGAFSGCTALTSVIISQRPTQTETDRRGGERRTVTIPIRWSGNVFSGCSGLLLAAQAALKQAGYTGSF